MASKGLGPLPRRRGSALAHGCGRGGRVVLPLARAAAVSTGLRVLAARGVEARRPQELGQHGVLHGLDGAAAQRQRDVLLGDVRDLIWSGFGFGFGFGFGLGLGLAVRVRVRVRVRVSS